MLRSDRVPMCDSGLVMNFSQANDDTRWFGLMRGELRETRIAPIRNPYHFSFLRFHSRNLQQLQYAQSLAIEKEGVGSEEFAELGDCRMILGKHLGRKLRQRPGYLGFA